MNRLRHDSPSPPSRRRYDSSSDSGVHNDSSDEEDHHHRKNKKKKEKKERKREKKERKKREKKERKEKDSLKGSKKKRRRKEAGSDYSGTDTDTDDAHGVAATAATVAARKKARTIDERGVVTEAYGDGGLITYPADWIFEDGKSAGNGSLAVQTAKTQEVKITNQKDFFAALRAQEHTKAPVGTTHATGKHKGMAVSGELKKDCCPAFVLSLRRCRITPPPPAA